MANDKLALVIAAALDDETLLAASDAWDATAESLQEQEAEEPVVIRQAYSAMRDVLVARLRDARALQFPEVIDLCDIAADALLRETAGTFFGTECCAVPVPIDGDWRFCPKCGQECRVAEYDASVRLETAGTCATWQPIETAPKDGFVIVHDTLTEPTEHLVTMARYNTRGKWVSCTGWVLHPTHWMPLPARPAEETP